MTKIIFVGNGSGTWVPRFTGNVTVECWGAGTIPTADSGGGNGGSYAKKNTFAATLGSGVTFQVGVPSIGVTTSDTWFSSTATVQANGGSSGSPNIGDVTNAGGAGNGSGAAFFGGGGGAGGPDGVGQAGGGTGSNNPGGGGGASDGGSVGGNQSASQGGAGGNGFGGSGIGGTGGTSGSHNGTNGGAGAGGGGGYGAAASQGNGGNGGDDYDRGGGGGGGAGSPDIAGPVGGNGGTPGGGAGACRGQAQAGWGLIKITYPGSDPDQIIYGGTISAASVLANIPASWNGTYTVGVMNGGWTVLTQGFLNFRPSVNGAQAKRIRIPGRVPATRITPQPLRDYSTPPVIPTPSQIIARPPYRKVPKHGPYPFAPWPWGSDFTVNPNPFPDVGSIVFTGFAPSVDETVAPGPGSIVFTGQAPSADEAVLPGVGSIVFNGLAPSADESLLPGVGSVVFNGQAPTYNPEGVAPRLPHQLGVGPRALIAHPLRDYSTPPAGQTVAPGAGSIVFTGQAPSADEAVLPGTGAITFNGFAPSVDESLLPGVGSIVFTGNVPTYNPEGVAPRLPRQLGVGPRALIAHPLRDFSPPFGTLNVQPGTGTATVNGFAPSIDQAIFPGLGSIAFTGQAPSADEAVLPGAGSIAFNGLAPSLTAAQSVHPGVGLIAFAGHSPTLVGPIRRIIHQQPQFMW